MVNRLIQHETKTSAAFVSRPCPSAIVYILIAQAWQCFIWFEVFLVVLDLAISNHAGKQLVSVSTVQVWSQNKQIASFRLILDFKLSMHEICSAVLANNSLLYFTNAVLYGKCITLWKCSTAQVKHCTHA